jgi:hypothetical protein
MRISPLLLCLATPCLSSTHTRGYVVEEFRRIPLSSPPDVPQRPRHFTSARANECREEEGSLPLPKSSSFGWAVRNNLQLRARGPTPESLRGGPGLTTIPSNLRSAARIDVPLRSGKLEEARGTSKPIVPDRRVSTKKKKSTAPTIEPRLDLHSRDTRSRRNPTSLDREEPEVECDIPPSRLPTPAFVTRAKHVSRITGKETYTISFISKK